MARSPRFMCRRSQVSRDRVAQKPEADSECSRAEPRPPVSYYSSIPLHAMNDPRLSRRYSSADAPRLRDIRKRLDSQISVEEVDSVRAVLDYFPRS